MSHPQQPSRPPGQDAGTDAGAGHPPTGAGYAGSGRAPDGPAPGPYPPAPGPYPPVWAGPTMSPSDERSWSTLAHLAWLPASLLALAPLGPLVVWLVFKDRSPVVRHHALEALNLWLTVYLVGVVCGVTFWLVLPLLVLVVVAVAAFVLSIVAAVSAGSGAPYRYPLILRLVR